MPCKAGFRPAFFPAVAARRLLALAAAFFFCASASASWISFSFTNYDATAITNDYIVYPVGNPAADANGNVTAAAGLPKRYHSGPDGRSTNFLQQQNYFVTNTAGGPNFLGKGYCFRAPLDNGPTVYPSAGPGQLISGLNYFVNLTLNGGTNATLTFNQVTNALGYTPLSFQMSLVMLTNIAYTNVPSLILGQTLYLATNYVSPTDPRLVNAVTNQYIFYPTNLTVGTLVTNGFTVGYGTNVTAFALLTDPRLTSAVTNLYIFYPTNLAVGSAFVTNGFFVGVPTNVTAFALASAGQIVNAITNRYIFYPTNLTVGTLVTNGFTVGYGTNVTAFALLTDPRLTSAVTNLYIFYPTNLAVGTFATNGFTVGYGTNTTAFALLTTQTSISNFLYWTSVFLQAQKGAYTNSILISGGTGTFAAANGIADWNSAFGAWTNGSVQETPAGIISISGIAVQGAVGGIAVGSPFTNITGSGILAVTAFLPAVIAAGPNVTITTTRGTNVISSTGGTGSITNGYTFYQTNLAIGTLVTNGFNVGYGTNTTAFALLTDPRLTSAVTNLYIFYPTNLAVGTFATNGFTVGYGTNTTAFALLTDPRLTSAVTNLYIFYPTNLTVGTLVTNGFTVGYGTNVTGFAPASITNTFTKNYNGVSTNQILYFQRDVGAHNLLIEDTNGNIYASLGGNSPQWQFYDVGFGYAIVDTNGNIIARGNVNSNTPNSMLGSWSVNNLVANLVFGNLFSATNYPGSNVVGAVTLAKTATNAPDGNLISSLQNVANTNAQIHTDIGTSNAAVTAQLHLDTTNTILTIDINNFGATNQWLAASGSSAVPAANTLYHRLASNWFAASNGAAVYVNGSGNCDVATNGSAALYRLTGSGFAGTYTGQGSIGDTITFAWTNAPLTPFLTNAILNLLSASVALLNTNQTFTGANGFTNTANRYSGTIGSFYSKDYAALINFQNDTNIGAAGSGNNQTETNEIFGDPSVTFLGSGGKLGNLPLDDLQKRLYPVPGIQFNLGGGIPSETIATNVIVRITTNLLVNAGMNVVFIEDEQYAPVRTNISGVSHLAPSTNFPNGFPYIVAYAKSKGINLGSYLQTGARPPLDPGTAPQYIETDIHDTMDWGFTDLLLDFGGADQTNAHRSDESNIDLLRRVHAASIDYNNHIDANSPKPRGLIVHGANLNDNAHHTFWNAEFSRELNQFPNTLSMFPSYTSPLFAVTNLENFWIPNSEFIGPGCPATADIGMTGSTTYGVMRLTLNILVMQAAEGRIDGTPVTFPGYCLALLENGEWWKGVRDPGVIMCSEVFSNATSRVFKRPMGVTNSEINIVWVVNLSSSLQNISVSATNLGLSPFKNYSVRELWSHQTITNFAGSFTVVNVNTNEGVILDVYPSLKNDGQYYNPLPNPQNFPPNYAYPWNSNGIVHLTTSNDKGDAWASDSLAGTAAFDPAQLGNLAVRYDSISSFPNQAFNTYVSGFEDRSGYQYSQNVRGENIDFGGPIFTNNPTALSGKSFVRYDGRASATCNSNIIFQQPITFFLKCTIPTNANPVFGSMFGGQNDFAVWHDEVDRPGQQCLAVEVGGQNFFMNGVYSGGAPVDLEVCINGSSSFVKTNNVLVSNGTLAANYSLTNLFLGHVPLLEGFGAGHNVGDFNLWSLLCFTNRTLTATEETNVFNWLDGSNAVTSVTALTGPTPNDGSGLTNLQSTNILRNTTGAPIRAGYVGEYTNVTLTSGSAVSMVTTTTNALSMALPAGYWKISAKLNIATLAATLSGGTASLSATSKTVASDGSESVIPAETSASASYTIPLADIYTNITSTTTFYVPVSMTVSGGVNLYGKIWAQGL